MAVGILLQMASNVKKFLEWKGTGGAGHVLLTDETGAAITTSTGVPVNVTGAVAAQSTVVASGAGNLQGVAAAANLRLLGYSITENGATAADARMSIRHGTGTGDPEFFDVMLSPGESLREWFGPDGIAMASGIYINRTSGTTKVTLFWKVVA
jgi:hypothetical protein